MSNIVILATLGLYFFCSFLVGLGVGLLWSSGEGPGC
jgi:hypothetical protein